MIEMRLDIFHYAYCYAAMQVWCHIRVGDLDKNSKTSRIK